MPKINASAIKPGFVLEHQSSLWAAVKTVHVKPGKGGAFAQVELKNLLDGRKLNERWRAEDRVEQATVEPRKCAFLYEQAETMVFMDQETFEQIELQRDFVGEDQARFLQDGMEVKIYFHEERPIGVNLPESVVLEIVEADAVVKNQTAVSSYKPAKASNGMRLMIPAYMEAGERVLVSTESGEYMRRAD